MIFELSNLECLYLNYNQLKMIPNDIGRLKMLQKLFMAYNMIDKVPNVVGDLVRLKDLGLRCNQIQTLPPILSTLQRLTKLSVECLPFRFHSKTEDSNEHHILSLKEIASREILVRNIQYQDLPPLLVEYLSEKKNHELECDTCYRLFYHEPRYYVRKSQICDSIVPLEYRFCSRGCKTKTADMLKPLEVAVMNRLRLPSSS
eukprot:TRINITY_DN826_c0_g1_i2.p1 TRINITY_DN826_c0_g1~~TRINITY_DN826_c0_g1_i2.p1  ORF type:complete len:202 (-),score=29.00 TRINITY_DN826_c0_g1_i2:12-617(-)